MRSANPTPQTPLNLNQGLRTALWIGAAGAPLLGILAGGAAAFGWLTGAFWNLLNIKLLEQFAFLLNAAPSRQARRRLILLLLAKFGGLYPVGFFLLWTGLCPVVPFAAGFTAVLFAVASGALIRQPWREAHV